MKILFTGASSFTGSWFVSELAAAGHEVVTVFRQRLDDYDGVRRARVDRAAAAGGAVFGCSFGDEPFMQLIRDEPGFDLLAHHAADVTNYKSPDFDVSAALRNNTLNITGVLQAMSDGGCNRVLLTGSVFEPGEGAGSEGLRAFSPYGLSKALTAQEFDYYCDALGLHFGKFVIANPFGPFEEPRFTQYLVRSWFEGKVPGVNTPAYVRDNIHVSLLAKSYTGLAGALPGDAGRTKLSPSGYIETQGDFARRFADEMRPRLGLACELELAHQTEFVEPRIRINTDPLDAAALGWDETAAWDELARYYQQVFAAPQTRASS